MKDKNHFLEFVKSRFGYKIRNEMQEYAEDIANDLLKETDCITKIEEVNVTDIEYLFTRIEDKKDMLIEFDVIAEVCINVTDGTNKGYESEDISNWYKIHCSCDLDEGFKNITIESIEKYYGKERLDNPVTGDLVPKIYGYEEYENFATKILKEHYSEALEKPMKIEPEILAKRIGLHIIEAGLSKDKSIFGKVFFEKSHVEVYKLHSGKKVSGSVKSNTAIIDTEAAFLYSFGSPGMTITHECIHYLIHKKAFKFARIYNKELKSIQCEVNGGIQTAQTNLPIKQMEIQANTLSPLILMPKEPFRMKVKEIISGHATFQDYDKLNSITEIMQEVADFFGVTIYAARKRMVDVGFDYALGALNWVDGKYVRPYGFKKGSLKKNEAYTISFKDAAKLLLTDSLTILPTLLGAFIFVENHVCLNDPKYIMKNIFGHIELTDYARRHVDECCLKFNYSTIGDKYNSTYGSICFLCKDSRFKYNISVPKDDNGSVLGNAKNCFSTFTKDKRELEPIKYMSLMDALKTLMKYYDVNVNELSDASGINRKTISRYINGETKNPGKNKVLALCIGLKLVPVVAQYLLDATAIKLKPGDEQDDAYSLAIAGLQGYDIDRINKLLRAADFVPLTTDKDKDE